MTNVIPSETENLAPFAVGRCPELENARFVILSEAKDLVGLDDRGVRAPCWMRLPVGAERCLGPGQS
jgi:hypothetical protein